MFFCYFADIEKDFTDWVVTSIMFIICNNYVKLYDFKQCFLVRLLLPFLCYL